MSTITPGQFHRLPQGEQEKLLRWLARHRIEPNLTYSVKYEGGSVAEVVVYELDARGSRFVRGKATATRVVRIECLDDAPPIPATV